jgi:hypothetical protein
LGRKKYTDDGELNAAIAIAKGIPAKAALKHAGYSEYVRRTPKKTLHNPRMQAAFKRLGLALLTETNSEYRHISGILEDRNAAPGLVLETAQQLHDEWVKGGKQETPGFAALPEICRVLLSGSDDNQGQDWSLVPIEEVTPEMVGTKALQLLWNELLDPPADARSRIQVISKGLEVGHLIGDRGELHLHATLPPVVQRMLETKMLELMDNRNAEAIDAEILSQEANQGGNVPTPAKPLAPTNTPDVDIPTDDALHRGEIVTNRGFTRHSRAAGTSNPFVCR